MAPPLNKLACLYLEKGEYSAAEPLFLKLMKFGERTLGEEHPTTIEAFHNLAELYYKRERNSGPKNVTGPRSHNWKRSMAKNIRIRS